MVEEEILEAEVPEAVVATMVEAAKEVDDRGPGCEG
jgi:hypothetical protein